jgi:hypothetical protein
MSDRLPLDNESCLTSSAEDNEKGVPTATEGEVQDEDETSVNFYPDTQKLTEGLLETFLPNIDKIRRKLRELDEHQGKTEEHIHRGIARFEEDSASSQKLVLVLAQIPQYRIKLEGIRKEMIHLHERTRKLKKRADRLREQRKRDDAERKLAQDRERERDKLLEAKVVKK